VQQTKKEGGHGSRVTRQREGRARESERKAGVGEKGRDEKNVSMHAQQVNVSASGQVVLVLVLVLVPVPVLVVVSSAGTSLPHCA